MLLYLMGSIQCSLRSSQVTIKTNILAERKHQAPNWISNSSDRELPRDMFAVFVRRLDSLWGVSTEGDGCDAVLVS